MGIERVTISRDDEVYECFPDVARTPSGRLICVYRESQAHSPVDFARVVIRVSEDEGCTWGERQVLGESRRQVDGFFEWWNCPRIGGLPDGRLWVVCDAVSGGESVQGCLATVNHGWWSADEGRTWSGPHALPVRGIVPDRIVVLSTGEMLLATHHLNPEPPHRPMQVVWRSRDGGAHWQGPTTVCADARYDVCEGSITELDDGMLVCYMRENSGQGLPALKALSADGGLTWEGPYLTLMGACHRPVAGLLASGNVLVTYRHQPGGAGYWAKNLFAYLESQESARECDRARQRGIVLPLDHDRSERSDSGYSGWVQLPDGRVFVVNYINDDAPMAQIRGYWLAETDF